MLKPFMFCKFYKGKNLIEKNICQIQEVGASGKDLLESDNYYKLAYSGKADFETAEDLVVYLNIFQNKLFARERKDLERELSFEDQEKFSQKYVVEKLSQEEMATIQTQEFMQSKLAYEKQNQLEK